MCNFLNKKRKKKKKKKKKKKRLFQDFLDMLHDVAEILANQILQSLLLSLQENKSLQYSVSVFVHCGYVFAVSIYPRSLRKHAYSSI